MNLRLRSRKAIRIIDGDRANGKQHGQRIPQGAVKARTRFRRKDGLYQKRDERTGEFMEVKQTEGKFKGVATEPDGRDTGNS